MDLKLGAPQGIRQGGALLEVWQGFVPFFWTLWPDFFFTSHANVTQRNRAAGKGNVQLSGKNVPLTKAAGRADVEDATLFKYPWHAHVYFWHKIWGLFAVFLDHPSDDRAWCAAPQNPLGSAVPVSSNGVLLKINCFLSILKQSTHQAVLRGHWQRRGMEGNWFSSWCNVGQSCQKVN